MATQKDYTVLRAIGSNKAESKGRVKAFGTTIQEIIRLAEKSGETISRQKVSQSLKKFIDMGYVEYGLSDGRTKTYIITDLGVSSLREVYGLMEEDE